MTYLLETGRGNPRLVVSVLPKGVASGGKSPSALRRVVVAKDKRDGFLHPLRARVRRIALGCRDPGPSLGLVLTARSYARHFWP